MNSKTLALMIWSVIQGSGCTYKEAREAVREIQMCLYDIQDKSMEGLRFGGLEQPKQVQEKKSPGYSEQITEAREATGQAKRISNFAIAFSITALLIAATSLLVRLLLR